MSKKKTKEYAGHTIVPVRCEGFRGVSQSLGHHIANDAIRDFVFDKTDQIQILLYGDAKDDVTYKVIDKLKRGK